MGNRNFFLPGEEREGELRSAPAPSFSILSPHMLNMMDRMKGGGGEEDKEERGSSPMNLTSSGGDKDEKHRPLEGRLVNYGIFRDDMTFLENCSSTTFTSFRKFNICFSCLAYHNRQAPALPNSLPPLTPRPPRLPTRIMPAPRPTPRRPSIFGPSFWRISTADLAIPAPPPPSRRKTIPPAVTTPSSGPALATTSRFRRGNASCPAASWRIRRKSWRA